MDHVDQGPDVINGSLGKNPMAQVEYVTGPPTGLLEDMAGLKFDFRQVREQDHRVKISLYCDLRAKPLPRSGQVNPPVESDHRSAGVTLQLQERSRVGAKVDRRCGGMKQCKESSHVRLDKPTVILRTQDSDPAIKTCTAWAPAII